MTHPFDFFEVIGYIHRTMTSPTQRERILFVDDDAELRAIVREQLTNSGYDVDEAEDGSVAMEKVQRAAYRVLLLDITMPGASGLDVLKFVKQRTPDCHVIMLTGVVGLSVAIESLKLGADDYITKPYNLDYLLSSIRRALQN
jgi:DNA-binding response OmpR family regulator